MTHIKDLNGVGRATVKKLEKAKLNTIDKIANTNIETLINLDISKNNAEKIIKNAKELNKEDTIKYDIKNSNKFLLQAFEKSEYYDEDNLEKAYDKWYKMILKL